LLLSAGGAVWVEYQVPGMWPRWLGRRRRTTSDRRTRMLSYEGGYAGQYDDSAGFVLEAHPDQPERRCDERQQGQPHERGKQEQPGRREAWCQRRPRVRTVNSNRDGRRHIVVLCASDGGHLPISKLLAVSSE
jgi:hypothetical protein